MWLHLYRGSSGFLQVSPSACKSWSCPDSRHWRALCTLETMEDNRPISSEGQGGESGAQAQSLKAGRTFNKIGRWRLYSPVSFRMLPEKLLSHEAGAVPVTALPEPQEQRWPEHSQGGCKATTAWGQPLPFACV